MGRFEQSGPAETSTLCSTALLISSNLVFGSALTRDLLVHGFNHRFDKPGFLLDKSFALEHASMAGNKSLEVQFHHSLQRGDLLDGETASEIRHRRVHQITRDQDLLLRQVGNSISNGVAVPGISTALRGFPGLLQRTGAGPAEALMTKSRGKSHSAFRAPRVSLRTAKSIAQKAEGIHPSMDSG